MHTTVDLLDLAKQRTGLHSDYKLAIALNMSADSAVTNYRKGRSRPDDDVAQRLAELCELPAEYVVACIHAERAKTETSRQFWQGLARKMSHAVAGLFMAVILSASIFGPPDANARTPNNGAGSSPTPYSDAANMSPSVCILCKVVAANLLARMVAFALRKISRTPPLFMGCQSPAFFTR